MLRLHVQTRRNVLYGVFFRILVRSENDSQLDRIRLPLSLPPRLSRSPPSRFARRCTLAATDKTEHQSRPKARREAIWDPADRPAASVAIFLCLIWFSYYEAPASLLQRWDSERAKEACHSSLAKKREEPTAPDIHLWNSKPESDSA